MKKKLRPLNHHWLKNQSKKKKLRRKRRKSIIKRKSIIISIINMKVQATKILTSVIQEMKPFKLILKVLLISSMLLSLRPVQNKRLLNKKKPRKF
jgi:hypothetical protein